MPDPEFGQSIVLIIEAISEHNYNALITQYDADTEASVYLHPSTTLTDRAY